MIVPLFSSIAAPTTLVTEAASVPLPAARAPGGHTRCLSPVPPPARRSGVSVLQEAGSKSSLSCSRWLLSDWRSVSGILDAKLQLSYVCVKRELKCNYSWQCGLGAE